MKYDFKKIYNKFVILIWILLFTLFWVQYLDAGRNTVEAFFLAASIVLCACPFTTYLSTRLLKKAMDSKNISKFIIQFFAFTFAYSALIPLIFAFFHQLETMGIFPQSDFPEWFNLGHQYLNIFLTSLIINLSFCGLGFFKQNMRLQKELADSNLQILQAQINPHFMFNVLNHINILIRKEPDLASSVLVQYTNILRYQLYNAKKGTVSIMQEVEFMKDFIEVEKIRWKNSLDVSYSWEIEDNNIAIVPLMLITFIENAFKHVSRSKTQKGYVHINIKEINGEITLTAENSKFANNQLYQKEEKSGIGLENIKKRLDILYHNRYKLLINETETVYSTTLSIKL